MIPRKWAWVCLCGVVGLGCEPAAPKDRGEETKPERARPTSTDREAALLRKAAGCAESDGRGWCAVSNWAKGGEAKLEAGTTWLGVRASIRGGQVTFSESAWVWGTRGAGEALRAGRRELSGLDARVRKGLARQTLEVAKGERASVVMETPSVAVALRAPMKGMEPVGRGGGVWRVGASELAKVGDGSWMSREEGADGVVEWTLWVEAKLEQPTGGRGEGFEVPLEKMRKRYGCANAPKGTRGKACEVLTGYEAANGEAGAGQYSGWFVRPAGDALGTWAAVFEGDKASVAQTGLKAEQAAEVEGGRFEVEGAFVGREAERVVVWTRWQDSGGWAIARSTSSGVVWFGRLEPSKK